MTTKKELRVQTVAVALRFEASPQLRNSLSEIFELKQRQLVGGQVLYFYFMGTDMLPVIFPDIDGISDTNSAASVLARYNRRLAAPDKGVMPYFQHYPVTGVRRRAGDDERRSRFDVSVQTTARERERLSYVDATVEMGDRLVLPLTPLRTAVRPPSGQNVALEGLRRTLAEGSLYVTHPQAVALAPYVDQYSKE